MGSTLLAIAAIITAVGALVTAVACPLILARIKSKEKQENWAREDQVAADLREANRLIAIEVKSVKEDATMHFGQTQEQLHEIHTLVNKNLTTTIKSELSMCEIAIAGLEEAGGITKLSEGKKDLLRQLRCKREELQHVLADRAAQQKKIDDRLNS